LYLADRDCQAAHYRAGSFGLLPGVGLARSEPERQILGALAAELAQIATALGGLAVAVDAPGTRLPGRSSRWRGRSALARFRGDLAHRAPVTIPTPATLAKVSDRHRMHRGAPGSGAPAGNRNALRHGSTRPRRLRSAGCAARHFMSDRPSCLDGRRLAAA